MNGILYMVATPIGNLDDITRRALLVLEQSAAIVCEDTRVTQKLLASYQINKPLLSYHHHSKPAVLASLLERLEQGQSLAYVCDAGTPGLSDPGGKLVAAGVRRGIKVVPIPGPSALTAILSVAGAPAQEFIFFGYPPHKKGRQKFLARLASSAETVIFYESTHRIIKTLQALAKLAPTRQLVVGRELTKKFESIYRGTPLEVLAALQQTSTLGEFVIVVV